MEDTLWSVELAECTCGRKPCTCDLWLVKRGDETKVSLRDYELAQGIVDRVNAAGWVERLNAAGLAKEDR
jgi:hypothetical protein